MPNYHDWKMVGEMILVWSIFSKAIFTLAKVLLFIYLGGF